MTRRKIDTIIAYATLIVVFYVPLESRVSWHGLLNPYYLI